MPTTAEIARMKDELLAKHREETRSQELAQAQAGIDWAINTTPTGEAREALTLASIFLTHAQNLLVGRTTPAPTSTPISDNNLVQQIADERYAAALQTIIDRLTA